MIDRRGGYEDCFRGHLPTAHHLIFDTLRGTDATVSVQYHPDRLTKALLKRAGADKNRLHLIYATGPALPNDEVLSPSMVFYVLEKWGIQNIRVVDVGLAVWAKQGLTVSHDRFGHPSDRLPVATGGRAGGL